MNMIDPKVIAAMADRNRTGQWPVASAGSPTTADVLAVGLAATVERLDYLIEVVKSVEHELLRIREDGLP